MDRMAATVPLPSDQIGSALLRGLFFPKLVFFLVLPGVLLQNLHDLALFHQPFVIFPESTLGALSLMTRSSRE